MGDGPTYRRHKSSTERARLSGQVLKVLHIQGVNSCFSHFAVVDKFKALSKVVSW